MSESLRRFVLNNTVASKIADMPLVGRHEGRIFVFVHGYPMTLRGFYLITTKALFGGTIRLAGSKWAELHAETQLLCQGLNMELQKGREAYTVLEGIKKSINWSEKSADKAQAVQWIKEVEEKVGRLGE